MKNYREKCRRLTLYFLILFSCVVVGYALVTQILQISGTSNVIGTWDVRITSIGPGEFINAENNTPPSVNSEGVQATFDVNLKAPGSQAIYPLVITNNGNIDAILTSIEGIDSANQSEPVDVTFSINANQNDIVNAGSQKTYNVTVIWNSNATTIPESTTKTATITLNYEQYVPTP